MQLIKICAISRKSIQASDDVVSFPYFESYPGEPEFVCCENIALRSEFERWRLRDRVIEKVRDFWTRWYRESKFFSILAENESFLIAKSTIENRVLLFFLNHVFSVEFTEDTWRKFSNQILTVEKGNIIANERMVLYWDMNITKGTLTLHTSDDWRDSIIIRMTEWRSLQKLLTTST